MQLQNKRFILFGVLVFIIILFSIFFITKSRNDIDSVPKDESSEISYTDQVYIHGGIALLEATESTEAYDSISKDLRYYAVNSYEKYKNEYSGIIGFKILGEVQKNNRIIELKGRFGASDSDVDLRIELFNYGKVSLSIKGGGNVPDGTLSSNSKRNAFIGRLPITETGYTIDYIEDEDKFWLNIFNSPDNYNLAINAIELGIGQSPLTEEVTSTGQTQSNIQINF